MIYPYFICAGRHSKRDVEDYCRRFQIAPHIISALHEIIAPVFDRLHATARHERQGYQHERGELLANERSYSKPTAPE